MAKKPFKVIMRVVAHVTVHVNEANAALAEEKANEWLEKYLPQALQEDVQDATVTDIENVDTFELDKADAKVPDHLT